MMALTLISGAHSMASDVVTFKSPALAAPYATEPGDERVAETLEILMIDPPLDFKGL